MKTTLQRFLVYVLSGLLFVVLLSCNKDRTVSNDDGTGSLNLSQTQAAIASFPKEAISLDEKEWLVHMREEEKLARDIYRLAYRKWSARIFSNISASEESHMAAVAMLLDKYELQDPVQGKAEGEFDNQELQQLYDKLAAQVSLSVMDAYLTGALIEDMDIVDLRVAMEEADNQDILYVYSNLQKGSRNHLRAFYRNITNQGGDYIPQFLTQSEFDSIVQSAMETNL